MNKDTRFGQLRKFANRYLQGHGHRDVTVREIAEWIVQEKFYDPDLKQVIGLCAEELSRALTTAIKKDPKGRDVREYCCARILTDKDQGKQPQFLSNKVENATYEMVFKWLHTRHAKVGSDIQQLKNDQDSFNENHLPAGKPPIQLSFAFMNDQKMGQAS